VKRLIRTTVPALAVAVLVLQTASAAADAPTVTPTGTVSLGAQYDSLCADLQRPTARPDVTIAKYIVGRQDNPDGSATLTVKLWGSLATLAWQAPVLDCLWIDTDGDGLRAANEPAIGALVEGLVVTADDRINGRGYFSVRLPGAANLTVCDQAYGVRSGEALPGNADSAQWRFTSQRICSSPLPPVEVPESGLVALLGVTGALTATLLLRRRPFGRRSRLLPS
jgi:hypothetical protein